MSETIIKVENLSKQYRIGAKEGYKTFRETLIDSAKAPFLLCRDIGKKIIRPFPYGEGSTTSSQRDEYIWALKDVSFEVKQGEVVGIIGRNGAGKSTLLKVLSKITEPTEGRVELRGRVGSLLEVGTGFHPELTGHENVYLYGAILGMDRWEVTRKFDEIIAFAELEKFIDTPVKRYSSGMYMRLAFAVAAHLEPEILLVDEVLAVGDAQFQKKCLGKMGDVSKQGRTVLFVSHNMGAISSLCEHAFLLERGRKVFDGPPVETVGWYMKGFQNIPAEWSSLLSPEKDGVSLQAVRVKDAGGNIRSEFSNQEDIIIEMDVGIKEWVDDLKVGFELEGEWGTTVFTTFHNDINEILQKERFRKGTYQFKAIIPHRLLNSHIYFVSPCAGIHRRRWLFREEKVVQFKVLFQIDNPSLTVETRPGITGPLLNWEVSPLNTVRL